MRLEKLALAITFAGLSALAIAIAIERGRNTDIIDKPQKECGKNPPILLTEVEKPECTFWQDGKCYSGVCAGKNCEMCQKKLNLFTTILLFSGTISTLISTYFLLESIFT